MPVGKAKVHDHQSEVVCESVSDEEPLAGEVLEPDLWLRVRRLVDESETPILDFVIQLESADRVLAAQCKIIDQ